MSRICKDCGIDTTPCTGKCGCRHKARWEHYMVRNEVWKAAKMQEGFLCIGCLEVRLGRSLKPNDFTDAPINDPDNPWNTPRLSSRLNAKDNDRAVNRQRLSTLIKIVECIVEENSK